jgi:hypothetical protein
MLNPYEEYLPSFVFVFVWILSFNPLKLQFTHIYFMFIEKLFPLIFLNAH